MAHQSSERASDANTLRDVDKHPGGSTKAHPNVPEKVDLGRYESFAPYLVRFVTPAELPPEHADLVSKIVVLDHRSLHALGVASPGRAEVKALLQNAVISAGYSLGDFQPTEAKPIATAAGLYKQAEEIFLRYMESRNRLLYICGVIGGVLLLMGGGFLAKFLPGAISDALPYQKIPALVWFAGLGALVSVLLRLSKLDVVREISWPILLLSGLGRPFVASAFAVVVYLAMTTKMLSVTVGDGQLGTGFVVAFLCGFSERFAQDILERTERGITGGARATTSAASPPPVSN